MEHFTVVSADGHVGAPLGDYREHLEQRHHEDLDALLRNGNPTPAQRLVDTIDRAFAPDRRGASAPAHAEWNPDRRVSLLEQHGAVAEVVFPNRIPFAAITSNAAPFALWPLDGSDAGRARFRAGLRAYNRWLAEFCASHPNQLVGVAAISIDDIDDAAAEVRWASAAGLRGILLPGVDDSRPRYYEPQYEPLWDLCEDLELVVNVHGGLGLPEYRIADVADEGPVVGLLMTEYGLFAHRPLKPIVWGGVLERHPRLRLVFAEQRADWVPSALSTLNYQLDGGLLRHDLHDIVRRRPSDYWARQCAVAPANISRDELRLRNVIGVDTMLFAMNLPRRPAAWPDTVTCLRATVGAVGMAVDEAAAFLGGNTARIYGLERTELDARAQTVGPRIADVLQVLDGPVDPAIAADVLRPAMAMEEAMC